jgi:hypothetical protein
MKKASLALLVLALLGVVCHQALFVAPPGSSITLFANPEFVPAHGGVSVITAFVVEPAGTPVADGTVVQFFTNLGRIDEQGRTNDGVARVNFVSDSRSGTARITAVSGGPAAAAPAPSPTASPGTTPAPGTGVGSGTGSASVSVTVGSALPTKMLLRAEPPRITESRSTHVIATVFDANGNPAVNVPVYFDVVEFALEFMENQGPVFTNQNGEAESVMRTRRPGPVDLRVRVRARTPSTAANFIEATIDIQLLY